MKGKSHGNHFVLRAFQFLGTVMHRELTSVAKILFVVLLIVFGSLGCDRDELTEVQRISPLVVPQDELDLGDMWAGSRSTRVLHLTNTSTRVLKISEFRRSCGCVSVTPSSAFIPRGGEQELRVVIEVQERQPNDISLFKQQIIPIIEEAEGAPPVFTLVGHVQSLIDLSRDHLTFEGSVVVTEPERIAVRSRAPLKSIVASSGEGPFATAIHKKTESSFELLIYPPKSDSVSTFWGEVLLTCQLESGGQVVCRGPSVSGRELGVVAASPDEVNVGFLPVGETVRRCIVLRATHSADEISIKKCNNLPENVQVQVGDFDRGMGSLVFQITAVAEGRQRSQVKLALDAVGYAPSELSIPVSYFGLTSSSITDTHSKRP